MRRIDWDFERFASRLAYYGAGVCRDLVPDWLAKANRRRQLEAIDWNTIPAVLRDRVDYYNRLDRIEPGTLLSTARDADRGMSRYYYDFMESVAGFGRDRRLNVLFGDVTHVPNRPTFVRSRPIAGNNANSVLLKLDRLRHFRFPRDKLQFDDKAPTAVWRGAPGNLRRRNLVRRFHGREGYDIGHTGAPFEGLPPKPYLTIAEQRRYRYIVSLEGNDVATNLKWVLSSNSLCFSPALSFETWFMEGALVPGVHYVELRPDCLDLEDKVDFYNRHPALARTIIQNAHAHVARFGSKKTEWLISLLVAYKYFELSLQVPDRAFRAHFFA